MKTRLTERLNFKKATRFTVVINLLQVAAMVAVLVYTVVHAPTEGRQIEIAAVAAALLIVTWGAVSDIREALNAGRIVEQARMLEEVNQQLESLNATLRKQRHDFMNHLQVVFSLLELNDPGEAMKYVESIYGDIKRGGSALKTANPAVNALIAAKRQDCQAQDISLVLHIQSPWQGLPVPGWEMCRVLGNLIDNARDALLDNPEQADKRIDLTIDETPGAFIFRVGNNGPAIPPQLHRSIFQMGFTTKSDGHGSGLSIVEEIVKAYGGEIAVASNDSITEFIGSIPKKV